MKIFTLKAGDIVKKNCIPVELVEDAVFKTHEANYLRAFLRAGQSRMRTLAKLIRATGLSFTVKKLAWRQERKLIQPMIDNAEKANAITLTDGLINPAGEVGLLCKNLFHEAAKFDHEVVAVFTKRNSNKSQVITSYTGAIDNYTLWSAFGVNCVGVKPGASPAFLAKLSGELYELDLQRARKTVTVANKTALFPSLEPDAKVNQIIGQIKKAASDDGIGIYLVFSQKGTPGLATEISNTDYFPKSKLAGLYFLLQTRKGW